MKKIIILTKGFDSPNGAAFLFPMIQHRKALQSYGITVQFCTDHQQLSDADVIAADSKYFSRWWKQETDAVIALFHAFRKKANRVLFFDINDSCGWPHARILPHVDAYIKNQLLVDKTRYLKPLYGQRLYTDYYHQKMGVIDEKPSYSEVISEAQLLPKLKLGWNSGLADYSPYGPYRMMLYHRLPYRPLLHFPKKFMAPGIDRSQTICCRMGIQYARESVSWQRKKIREKLQRYLATDKISRRHYFQELAQSKIVISPFGLGEITLKDFEVFLTGGLLVKPDMSHMETWPNWYVAQKTFVPYAWDLSDLDATLEKLQSHYSDYLPIAETAQENYKRYLVGDEAKQLFCEHFINVCFLE